MPVVRIAPRREALSASLPTSWLIDAAEFEPDDAVRDGTAQDDPNHGETTPPGAPPASGQTAVVIDTGVAYDHETFHDGGVRLGEGFGPGYRVVGGWDFAENDADPYDDGPAGFHGTHVAGTMVDRFESSAAAAGVTSDLDIVALRVFDDYGQSELSWVEDSLRWVHDNRDAFEHPITTVNLSIAVGTTPEAVAAAREAIGDELRQLAEDGIAVFAAAGNDFSGPVGLAYPASDPSVISVASGSADGLDAFSRVAGGVWAVDGTGISGPVPDHVYGIDGVIDDTAELTGTSFAAPRMAADWMVARDAVGDDPATAIDDASREHADARTGATYRTFDPADLAAASDPAGSEPITGDEADHLTLDLRGETPLLVDGDGVSHRLPGHLDGLGGADRLDILGGAAFERVVSGADGGGNVRWGESLLSYAGFEHVRFVGGFGDRMTMNDSAGSDVFESVGDTATLSGVGYRIESIGVTNVYAHATAGGHDVARLHAADADVSLAIRPDFTSLRTGDSPIDPIRLAYGFDAVEAYAAVDAGAYAAVDATGIGSGSVAVYGSDGDDVVSLSSRGVVLSGDGYRVDARGFGDVDIDGGGAGHDTARVYLNDLDADGTLGDLSFLDRFEHVTAYDDAYRPVDGHTPIDWASAADDDRRRLEAHLSRIADED